MTNKYGDSSTIYQKLYSHLIPSSDLLSGWTSSILAVYIWLYLINYSLSWVTRNSLDGKRFISILILSAVCIDSGFKLAHECSMKVLFCWPQTAEVSRSTGTVYCWVSEYFVTQCKEYLIKYSQVYTASVSDTDIKNESVVEKRHEIGFDMKHERVTEK